MKNYMNKTITTFIVLTAIIFTIWILDVISDRHHELEILKPITLLEHAPQDYPKDNKSMGTIQAGEHIEVLRRGYGKDFCAWKVRGSRGQEGWFIEEHDNAKIKN